MHTFAGHVWLVVDSQNRPIGVFEAVEGGAEAILTADSKLSPKKAPWQGIFANVSPDGKWLARFKDHNLVLKEISTSKEHVLTKTGSEADRYGGIVYWSPDSTRLVAMQTTKAEERKIYMVESSPRDQFHPKLHTLNYAKPGDPMPISKPHLFDVAGLREIPVSDDLFKNPWSIQDLHWDKTGKEFSFLFNQRGHQVLH